MSRNVRQKPPVTPTRVTKRRGSDSSSSLDLSDEDGYSGVDDISDSDDEDDVMAAEEQHILHNEVYDSVQSSPRPGVEDEDDDEAVEEDEEEEEEDDDDDDDDDEEAVEDDEDDEDDGVSSSWEGFMSDDREQAVADNADQDLATERRVRFDVPESDGDSTETDDDAPDFFPDIFVDKRSLDPSFRREIDLDDQDQSSDSGGFWDFTGTSEVENSPGVENNQYLDSLLESEMDSAVFAAFEEDDSTPVATPMTSQDLTTAVSTPMASPDTGDDLSLDGYESDGDTTDEEDPPEQVIRRNPHSRRERTAESSDSDATKHFKLRRGKPRVGRFNLDSSGSKPVAVVHPRTGKLMIFTPQRLRRLDLSPEQFSFPFFDPSSIQSSPILSTSGNLMMGAMFASGTFGDYVNTQAVGPAEAFFPTAIEGAIIEESSADDDGEEDEGEHGLHLDDFITFDENDSSDEDPTDGPGDNDDIMTSPARPTTASSDIASLLDHFEGNSNVVGAFRRDQANHQLIRNGKASRESLAFSGPLFQGTLRGIKAGRIATTNVPITPLRRRKDVPDLASSPLSGMSQKRKSSSDQHFGHKRQRSIPDVTPMRI